MTFRSIYTGNTLAGLVVIGQAKFSETYDGLVPVAVAACEVNTNWTREYMFDDRNSREVFSCIMENIDSYHQSLLSAGLSILGFVRRSNERFEGKLTNDDRT